MGKVVTVERSSDCEFFLSVLNDEIVKAGSIDDDHKTIDPLGVMALVEMPKNIFLKVLVDGEGAGFFMLIWISDGIFEAHTCILPHYHGALALRAARAAINAMFNQFFAQEIRTYVFDSAKHVMLFTQLCGFARTTEEPHASTVNGKLAKRVNYVLTKSTFTNK